VSLAILSDLVINVSSDVGPVFGVRTPETPPADDSRVVALEADVVPGAPIKRVQPKPPAIRVPGTVVVEITVDEQGDVVSTRAVSGHPLLRPAAVSAAREWKFSPTTAAGIPIKVIGSLSFNFQ
jgi:protein TonB